MNHYRTSDLAVTLGQYVVNPDEYLASVHPDMLEETHQRLKAHNDALLLLAGADRFAPDWAVAQFPDHGQFAVFVDSLASALKFVQWWQVLDADMARHRVAMVAKADASHPIAKHWQVLQARCYAPGQVQEWPEVEAILADAEG